MKVLACGLLLAALCIHSSVSLRFLVVGDWGTGDSDQRAVAEAMANYADTNTVDFIMSTGDNFYPNGVEDKDDLQFITKWREMYNIRNLANLVWYISVGNHDHRLNEWAQVEFGKDETRWYFPNITYSFTKNAGSTTALFISFDSQTLEVDKAENDPDGIVRFVQTELEQNQGAGTWRFAFAHHPAYSCSSRAGSEVMRQRIVPLLEQNNADIFFVGHDHNLQHLRKRGSANNVDHVTSGGGGRGIYGFDEAACILMDTAYDMETYFGETHGFCAVNIVDNNLDVTYFDTSNSVIYSFNRVKTV